VSTNELILTAKTFIGDCVNQIDRQFDLNLFLSKDTLHETYLLKSARKFPGQRNATTTN
jgi:hypothetical protein